MAVMPPEDVKRPATVTAPLADTAACRVAAELTVRVLLLLVPRTALPCAVSVPVTDAVLAKVAAPVVLVVLAKVPVPATESACRVVLPPPDDTEMPPAMTVRPPLEMVTPPAS